MGHLERLKNRATYLLKDSLKIARVVLVDVSTAELMTEDATNADEWGPTTKQMAEIAESSNNSEDYLRIVHTLHERFALNIHKYWKQIHKSLILLEYLLCHGPEHFVMEFRQDTERLKEFTHFKYSESWKPGIYVDRGSAVLERRAKHVLHLLMDEEFYRNERTSAQKISKGRISGFGSESLPSHSSKSQLRSVNVPRSQSTSSLPEIFNFHHGSEDSSSLLAEDYNSEPETPSTSGRSSAFSTSFSGSDSSAGSARSTNSTSSEDSSTLSFRKTSQVLDMDSVASASVVERSPPPSVLLHKLPPPPSRAGYKVPLGKQQAQSSVKLAHVPDLITI